MRLPPGSSVETALRALRDRGDVEFAQPDITYSLEAIPDDSLFGNQWGLHNLGQTIGGAPGTVDADIDADFAWDVTTGSDDLIVAVIDSGVDVGHVDLQANIFVNADEAGGTTGVDDDGNGHIDDVRGFDFVNDDPNVSDDVVNHGTIVASVLGGREATRPVRRVSPSG